MKKKKLLEGEHIPKITINYNRPYHDEMYKIQSSGEVANLLRKTLFKDNIDYKETVFALYLTRSLHVLGSVHIGTGNLYSSGVDIAEIISVAVPLRANSVILCHNHPGGNAIPSPADLTTSKRLKEALELMNMNLLDHLIITKETYYSFADEGDL